MKGKDFKEITWYKGPDFLEHCRSHPVSAGLRPLLVSDGTVVSYLKGLLLGEMSVEGLEQHEVTLEEEEADFFRQAIGTHGLFRRVWLVQNRRRWVYALSFFPLGNLRQRFRQELTRSALPLGSLIQSRGLFVYRNQLEICRLRHPQIATEMEYAEEEPLWGRRYHLEISDEASASIFEVFSPRL